VLGHEYGPGGLGNLMAARSDLLLQEYQEVNAHLRANITQFVNWFSFFLTLSLIAAAIFVAMLAYRPQPRGFVLLYGVQLVFLLMHLLAFVGIFTFRRYIMASHCKIEDIIKQLAATGGSPIPVRFCQWMTDLMAAGFVISYFIWFSLLFLP
jgi:hypothetical protein